MSIILNRVSDDIVRGHIEYQEGRLAKLLSEPEDSKVRSNAQRYAKSLAATTFDLGVDYYQQEKPTDQIIQMLALSAHHWAESIALRQVTQADTYLPTEYDKALSLAFCFGASRAVSTLLDVDDSQVYLLSNTRDVDLYRSSFLYCKLLQDMVRKGEVDHLKLVEAKSSATRPNTWRFDQIVDTNKLRAIEAVNLKDSASFNQAMQVLVEDHKNESMSGDLQKLPDANIAISLLMLSKLALDKAGLATTVQSVYLPLHLLQ